MTFDKFMKRSQLISEHIQRIASSAAAVSRFDTQAPTNPLLREVFSAQERLLIAAEELLETAAIFETVTLMEEEVNTAG